MLDMLLENTLEPFPNSIITQALFDNEALWLSTWKKAWNSNIKTEEYQLKQLWLSLTKIKIERKGFEPVSLSVLLMECPADQLSYQANCVSVPYCKQEYNLLKMSRLVAVKRTGNAQYKGTDNAWFLEV